MSRKSATKAKFSPHAGTQMAQLLEVEKANAGLAETVLELKESLADVTLALDNIGWSPLGGEYGDMRELPLQTIKDQTKVTRALAVINPLIKRGIAVRTAYIWGNGIKLDGLDETSEFAKHAGNKKYLFSEKAQMEMESCLATDGNFFLMVTKKSARSKADRLTRVPMWQITGAVSDPENAEDIWFYKREWNTVVTNAATEQETVTPNVEYYPAIDYDETNGKPTQFKGKRVNWDSRIAAHSVNKQSGWKWGVPDILPVMFWAKAHKEFLESQATLVKAYSRFAWKVAAPTAANARAASTKVGTAPSLDPMTGQPQGVGATAVTGQGTTISSVGRTGGSVDFEAGLPLAGYVAAGLSVPLNELTADAGNANRASAETLSGSNEKVMKARQAEHKMFYEAIFAYLGMDVKVSFEKIEQEAVYRQIQSLVSLLPLNLFSDKEMRALIVHVLDLQDLDPEKVPSKEELGNLILQATMAAEAADKAAAQAEKLAKANPPVAGAPGAPGPKALPAGGKGPKKADSTAKSYGDNSYRKDAANAARNGAKG
jgi:hypothetical protein